MTRRNGWWKALAAALVLLSGAAHATDFDEADELRIKLGATAAAFEQKVQSGDVLVVTRSNVDAADGSDTDVGLLHLSVDGAALPPTRQTETVLRIAKGGTLRARIEATQPQMHPDDLNVDIVVHRIPAARLMPVERYRLEVGGKTRVVVPDTKEVGLFIEVTGAVTTDTGATLTPMQGGSLIHGSMASERALVDGELGASPYATDVARDLRPLQQFNVLPLNFTAAANTLEITLPEPPEVTLASGGYDVSVYRLRPVAWQQPYGEPIKHQPLCNKGEKVAFSCLREDGTTVSICGVGQGDPDGDHQPIQLRFGRKGRTEWSYPPKPAASGWFTFDHDPLPTEGYGRTRFTVDAKPYKLLIRRSGVYRVHYLYDTGFRVAVSGPGRKESEPLRCVESKDRWEQSSREGP